MISATLRAPVALPRMPSQSEALEIVSPARMARSELQNGRLVFDTDDGFETALSDGFFLLRAPEGLNLRPADLFARHFFEDRQGDPSDIYRGFRGISVPGDYQGYFDREHDQWENFYIEMSNWGLLPAGVAAAGHRMTDIGIAILRSILDRLGVPADLWQELTGGLSERRGHQMLAFNHFRPDRRKRGCKFHRDSGWVTVLRSDAPGLLAFIDGELRRIDPEPGYLIVNFGSSIEVLTNRMNTPVRASVHGVFSTERDPGQPDRASYVVFLDSRLDGTIYQIEDGRPHALQSVADFAVQEVNRTYDDMDAAL